jgi:hypothetical protein
LAWRVAVTESSSMYFPAGQFVQLVEVELEYFPKEQILQTDEAGVAYFPGEQSTQSECDADATTSLYFPPSQLTQVEETARSDHVPASQSTQESPVAPGTRPRFPLPQSKQADSLL